MSSKRAQYDEILQIVNAVNDSPSPLSSSSSSSSSRRNDRPCSARGRGSRPALVDYSRVGYDYSNEPTNQPARHYKTRGNTETAVADRNSADEKNNGADIKKRNNRQTSRLSTPSAKSEASTIDSPSPLSVSSSSLNTRHRNNNNRRALFPSYLSSTEISAGLSDGRFVKGVLRIVGGNAFVSVPKYVRDIFIYSRRSRNRAFDGDIVAVQLTQEGGKHNDTQDNITDAITDTLQSLTLSPPANGDTNFVTAETKQAHGVVVGIIESAHVTRLAGYFQWFSENIALFIPLDKKSPYALLPKRLWPDKFIEEQLIVRPHNGSDKADSKRDGQIGAVEPLTCQQLYLVEYGEWSEYDRLPICRIINELGMSGQMYSETEALLYQSAIDYPHDGAFTPQTLAEVRQYEEWTIPTEEIASRLDLRQKRIFTIDPTTARDLDDALSIEVLPTTSLDELPLYRIGVHIADVSYFVKPGTSVDEEAAHRATTVYLVDRAIPMLPRILCDQQCSLNPNVDRLAYSCFFTMTSDGVVVPNTEWFGKSIIRVCSRLDYQTAQMIIEHRRENNGADEADLSTTLRFAMRKESYMRPAGPHTISAVFDDVHLLNSIAMKRRVHRFSSGSLALDNIKLHFDLDSNGYPIAFQTYTTKDSNRLVEEYMLLANMLVARKLIASCNDHALLRCHQPPSQSSISKVASLCKSFGFEVEVESSKALHNSLKRFEDERIGDSDVSARLVLEPMCTRPMQQAQYISSGMCESEDDWAHYALAFTEYTHFTSPIRRYADVTVHRLLTRALTTHPNTHDHLGRDVSEQQVSTHPMSEDDNGPFTSDMIQSICDRCNTRKVNAKKASEQSARLYLCLLLHHRYAPLATSKVQSEVLAPFLDTAIIVGMQENVIDIILPRLGIDRRIYLRDIFAKKVGVEKVTNINSDNNNGNTSDRLTIEWSDGRTEVKRIFDGLNVQLTAKMTPPIDIIVTVRPSQPAISKI